MARCWSTGALGAACVHGEVRNTGDLSGRPCVKREAQESEGPMVPAKRGNSRGGTGPWFRVLSNEWTRGRLA